MPCQTKHHFFKTTINKQRQHQGGTMKMTRGSGLLMHITSLPGTHGIGTMGQEAYDFVDLLQEGGQHYWQTLPFGPVSSFFGYSPYSSLSSFAGNALFINLEKMHQEPWMKDVTIPDLPEYENGDFVDFDSVCAHKLPLLKQAAEHFFLYANKLAREEFRQFCQSALYWLDDYALYMAISSFYNNFNWLEWEPDIRLRTPKALKKWHQELHAEIDYHRFVQFIFYRQWAELKEYTNKKGIQLIGDIPIYVNLDSADAWSHPDILELDKTTLRPERVAGVPPDYFSPTGQRWGNPLYCWQENGELKQATMEWWVKRLVHMFTFFDITRLDHFRGFESYWAIPATEYSAINGKWEKGPDIEFFNHIKKQLGKLPIIAEDLGIMTPAVEKLRGHLGLPGMKILQFAFDYDNKNSYLPHNYTTTHCVVYTGTHDNNTTNGWFYEQDLDENRRRYVMEYLHLTNRDQFHWHLIDLALSSTADLAMFPVQDILGYGSPFRMNTPGQAHNNWRWKLNRGRLNGALMQRLKNACIMYNRI